MKAWLILAAGALASIVATTHMAHSANDRELVVALVPKGSVERFYNRLASADKHLVVTDEVPEFASDKLTLTLKPNEELFIVEPQKVELAPLPGEIARIGKFVIVKLWQQPIDEHVHLGNVENYVVRLNTQLTDLKQIKSKKSEASPIRLTLRQDLNLDVDPEFLKTALEHFSGVSPTVVNGETIVISERGSSAGRTKAIDWLKQQYNELGYSVSIHDYGRGKNFEAERPGLDTSKTVIVSAHLDSVSNAGADDDGSGTISALAIAKALQNYDLKYNLRIVGFDEEEKGLVGSARYASYLKGKGELTQIVGVFNIEMTGYDRNNDGHMHVIDCNENTSSELSKLITDAIDEYQINLTKVPACTNRSDHASFWKYDVPAIVVSQNFFGGDSNPCYHRACDRTDIINWKYMTEMTKALAYGIASAVVQ